MPENTDGDWDVHINIHVRSTTTLCGLHTYQASSKSTANKYRYRSCANKLLHFGVHRQHEQIQDIFLVVQSSLPDSKLLHTVVITWDRCPSVFVGSKHLQHMPVLKPRNVSCPDPLYPPHALGLFSTVALVGKLIFQDTWTRGLAWDELLPTDIAVK